MSKDTEKKKWHEIVNDFLDKNRIGTEIDCLGIKMTVTKSTKASFRTGPFTGEIIPMLTMMPQLCCDYVDQIGAVHTKSFTVAEIHHMALSSIAQNTEKDQMANCHTPLILLLETALLRIAKSQNKKSFENIKTDYISSAIDRGIAIDSKRWFEFYGMSEILEFSEKFWSGDDIESLTQEDH